jgi:GTPase involved in cell partitioning and DNA repair
MGLVGFPNAGKSSLVNILTSTLQKEAPYPKMTVIRDLETIERLRIGYISGLISWIDERK